jgi:hypothetical protein
VDRGIAAAQVVDAWLARFDDPDRPGKVNFDDLRSLFLLQKLLTDGAMDRESALDAAALCRDTVEFQNPQLVILRKLGVTTVLLHEEGTTLRHDGATKEVLVLSLAALSAELKERLGKEGQ